MTDIVKLVLIGICFLLLINIVLPKIRDFFVRRNQNKLLKNILESDPVMKQLIKNMEQKIKRKVKFVIHPLSILYNNIHNAWGIDKSGRISIPLDRNKTIISHNKDQQIFTFAHELVHLRERDFEKNKKSCGYKLIDCLLEELRADFLTIELLREINIEVGDQIFKNQKQEFWSERLKVKVDIQCERCHKIVKEQGCPELQKILEYLNKIASEARIELIADPVPLKKGGVTFYFNNFKNCSTGRVFAISFFVAQPRRAWAMPNSK